MITLEELKNWARSDYNEDTCDELNFYLNERKCDIGDPAYMYSHAEEELFEMTIVHIISRSSNRELYDELVESNEALIDGEFEYDADTSAEFITDNDCYMVWFRDC